MKNTSEEWLDIVDEHGNPTGETISRKEAHRKGIAHRTSHVWIVRMRDDRLQILLQKRSDDKDSYPGCYDISSAGHIPAGADFIPSAIRELREELGVEAKPGDLVYCGQRRIRFEEAFHGELFRDNQVSNVYLLWLDREEFTIQREELSGVVWFDFDDCMRAVKNNTIPHCIYEEELLMVQQGAERSRIIEDAKNYVRALFRDNAGGHDFGHTMRVYGNALAIAEEENACDRQLVMLAALLHDADDHRLFSTKDNQNARAFLREYKVSPDRIDQICEVINAVSFSQNIGKRPRTIEAQIVQDADRLDAMGAVGIARTFAYGGEHARPMEESLQHFHDKLLHLKDLMNTNTGRRLAGERHVFLVEFLQEYEKESQ